MVEGREDIPIQKILRLDKPNLSFKIRKVGYNRGLRKTVTVIQ
jgi:hypothetical protein